MRWLVLLVILIAPAHAAADSDAYLGIAVGTHDADTGLVTEGVGFAARTALGYRRGNAAFEFATNNLATWKSLLAGDESGREVFAFDLTIGYRVRRARESGLEVLLRGRLGAGWSMVQRDALAIQRPGCDLELAGDCDPMQFGTTGIANAGVGTRIQLTLRDRGALGMVFVDVDVDRYLDLTTGRLSAVVPRIMVGFTMGVTWPH